jgi:hypothetical protein
MTEQPRKPFERRWSTEQQRAIAHAMLDASPTLSAPEAAAAALAGTLPGAGAQLEPFGPVPVSTCYEITRRERRGREVQSRGRLAKAGSTAKAVAIVLADSWSELDRTREDLRRAKIPAAERAKALREIALTAQTIARVERDLTGEKPRKPTPSTEPTTDKPKRQRTEADDLARAARKRAQTEHQGPTDTQQGTAPTTGAQANGRPDHATDADARVQAIDRAQLASSLA